MMNKLFWTKLTVGFTQDPRIQLLVNEKKGLLYFFILFVIRDFASLFPMDGYVYLTGSQAMTSDNLASLIHRHKNTVEQALDRLEEMDFIQRDEKGVIYLCGWDDIQNLAKLNQVREQNKIRQAAYRQRQKEKAEQEVQAIIAADKQDKNGSGGPNNTGEDENTLEGDGVEVVYFQNEETRPLPGLPLGELAPKASEGLPTQTNELEPLKPTAYGTSLEREAGSLSRELSPKVTEGFPSKSKAITLYQQLFGMIGGGAVYELMEMEDMWGSDSVCNAIHIARRKNVSRTDYIRGILRNHKGNVEGDAMTYGTGPGDCDLDEKVARLLRETGIQ